MNDPVAEKVIQVIARTFRVPAEEVTLSKKRGEIPGWDSLGHMTLMMEIESELGLRFPMDKIIDLETVAAICELAKQTKTAG